MDYRVRLQADRPGSSSKIASSCWSMRHSAVAGDFVVCRTCRVPASIRLPPGTVQGRLAATLAPSQASLGLALDPRDWGTLSPGTRSGDVLMRCLACQPASLRATCLSVRHSLGVSFGNVSVSVRSLPLLFPINERHVSIDLRSTCSLNMHQTT